MQRACRLLPSDDALALALASACLGQDDAKAVELFARLAARYGGREAWTGLAIARRNIGDLVGAGEAVSRALATLVPDPTLASVAGLVAQQLAAPGWCGASIDGVLDIRLTDGPCPIELEIDGQRRRKLNVGPSGAERVALPSAWWHIAHAVGVIADGRHLLGSPLEAHAIRRIEGCVTARNGGLDGWAWHPGDPTIDPVMTVTAASGEELPVIARDEGGDVEVIALLGRPRMFHVPPNRLKGMTGPFHLRGTDGADLMGSPLDPGREQRGAAAAADAVRASFPAGPRRARDIAGKPPLAAPSLGVPAHEISVLGVPVLGVPADIMGPSPPIGRDRRRRVADVVIPVHGGGATVRACLKSVLATVSAPSRIIVIDDATQDRDLAAELADLARRRRIRLVRHTRNRGYPASANAGMRACAGRDVVLLNSDTIVAPFWLDRLREIAYGAPDIGTVSPLTNNGTIVSYPNRDDSNAMPGMTATARLAGQADRANRGVAIDIPVAVGFCMYLRRDCLDAVGGFREDLFAQGYGEENDFCLRARHLGWRHVAAPGVFVAHRGAQSFGPGGEALRARNQAVLNRLHPGYPELIDAHVRSDPLAPARRRLDQARWRADRSTRRASTLLISHTHGGGVEQRLRAICAAHRDAGIRPIVLRPMVFPQGASPEGPLPQGPASENTSPDGISPDDVRGVVLGDGVEDGFPNLRFALPSELAELVTFLHGTGLREVALHHLLGHHPAIFELIALLGLPYDVHVHDYALICPRIALVGRERRYCGEPAVATCEACVADLGSISGEAISVAALRERSGRLLANARHVVAPSEDAAVRLRRHFPTITVRTVPYGDDKDLVAAVRAARPGCGIARICVIGALGVEKGYEILLACARDAAERDLPLEFVVVGHTIDDARLLDTGRVFVTGEYQPAEAVPMIQAQDAAVAWLPSVWPETWCFTLSEAWCAGLPVVAFDLGAQAERIRHTGGGVLLPLGLPPVSINSALLAASGLSDHR
jgi:GT2 family glycosyltransferase/glycosyltransferase involved in cell wall biosynthesis